MPWDAAYRLTNEERRAVASSIQHFQLGEGSEGKAFIERACRFDDDAEFLSTLRLGRFLDLHGIPWLKKHWRDQVFRRIRRMAWLELIIAVPYYRALHDATESPLLRALRGQILRDEAAHLP